MTDIGTAKQRSLRLGDLDIGFPVVQAALSGYSDRPMRIMARRFGAPYALAEVMLDRFVMESKDRSRSLSIGEDDHPIGGQLMGAEPAQFAPAAVRLAAAGYDVIDINFGCPVKKVLGRCRGGYHLGQPETALEIVARVRDAVPDHVPVTVKMRRSLDDTAASADDFERIFEGAFLRGVTAITVHGRTVQQRYDGPSNWDVLRQIKVKAGKRTVLGSGDLFTAESCREMIGYTGVDGVTVARGAIGNPWIFRETRALLDGKPLPPPPSVFEQRDVLAEHFRLAEQLYGAERCCRVMRKTAIRYAERHPSCEDVRAAFLKIRRTGDWQQILDRWYTVERPGRRPKVEQPIPLATDRTVPV